MTIRLSVRSGLFQDIYYPPQVLTSLEITNELTKFPALIQFTISYVAYPQYYTNYVKEVEIDEGTTPLKENLVMDPEIMRMVEAHLEKENKESVAIRVTATILHRNSDNSLSSSETSLNVRRADFRKSLDANSKLPANGLSHSSTHNPQLALNLSRIQDIIGNQNESLEARVFSGMIKYVKEAVMQEADVKAAESMKSLEMYAKEVSLGHNWIIAAVMLALHEIMVKYMVASEGIKVKDVKFNDLVNELRTLLQKEKVEFEEMQLSNLNGKRDYRHKVIHEGHEPNNLALSDIIQETLGLFIILKKLKEKKAQRQETSKA